MNKLIASIGGIGYIKGGGTIAAAVTCGSIWLLWHGGVSPLVFFALCIAVTLLGVFVGNKVEPYWGKDSYRVVIDEVAGMWITVLFLPPSLSLLIAGFILFRFFDIVKPLGVRRMEVFPGGWGVMADDVLAGIYANIVLQVAVFFHLLG
ncbi:phosphatidylglycerophosphatase A family protein [Mucilaginibacter auburnensis]|uniref:Phosphatidylglycerophosphatase A n=1 Tax=Mucilaginibacter auburnensis TaxID=1457233 RepID=A0A2H9VRH6_9SPHI|nr:phosphatidylglycerophosphatase A [Mucilaginibacter auburnensis]PJJ83420.1 phosphatidylglycerophosphatase A [Mucilaginibacter auburnensis]